VSDPCGKLPPNIELNAARGLKDGAELLDAGSGVGTGAEVEDSSVSDVLTGTRLEVDLSDVVQVVELLL
jgi:hypothetical protein